jgi:hypothetical protein
VTDYPGGLYTTGIEHRKAIGCELINGAGGSAARAGGDTALIH